MLTLIQGKRNSCSLLIGVKTGTATMKINTEFPPKAENRATHMSRPNYFGVYTKRTLISYYKDICADKFIIPLITIARKWKQPLHLPVDE